MPKNIDKEPEWRTTGVFGRDELITMISDPRIARRHRVFNALEGLAGVRHGEAAGLRRKDYEARCAPLGKLTALRSGRRTGRRTQVTRSTPVHPTLVVIVVDWRALGWAGKYGREPAGDDLVRPTERMTVRKPSNTLKHFNADLMRMVLRSRRGHDLRRMFITLPSRATARATVPKS